MWYCDTCNKGIMEWKGYEHIFTTNSESEKVIEIHSCYECSFCGNLHHTLINTIPDEEVNLQELE